MTDRIERLRRFFIVDKAHHAVRRPPLAEDCLAADFAQRKLLDTERAVERLCFMLRQEEPHLFPEERIAFVRTLPNVPELFTAEELEALHRSHWIHERGDVSNINVDYTYLSFNRDSSMPVMILHTEGTEEVESCLKSKGFVVC